MGRPDRLQGALELLILKSLAHKANHGFGITLHVQTVSDGLLRVEEGSLYPALQRLLLKGWVKGEWGTSENNRRARYYTLTAAGRKQLGIEAENFNRLIEAIARVMQTA